MTNQSKWLISAYAIFYCGGVLVPLDYKLSPNEQLRFWRTRARKSWWSNIIVARDFASAEFREVAGKDNPGNRGASKC